jgi:uncharacterized membrane protein
MLFFWVNSKERFTRFHFVQSALGWLTLALFAVMRQLSVGKGEGPVFLWTVGMIVLAVALVMALFRSLQGRYYRIWVLGPLAGIITGQQQGRT